MNLLAQEIVSDKYCHTSMEKMESNLGSLKTILLPMDRVEKSGHCLIIYTKAHRRNLIQEYLVAKDPEISAMSLFTINQSPLCHLKIEKKEKSSDQEKTQETLPQLTMEIHTEENFKFEIDQETIEAKCALGPNGEYDISFNRKNIQIRIQLKVGDKKEIGAVLQGQSSQLKSLTASPPIDSFTRQTEYKEEVFLTVL